ncbi:uroporphyrin-III C-methyltransferase, putative [Babesia ovata]|uniref:Uroporphyrin-III C-methyltransferase, putative n=1 Tax=Babesia ovata TaxID=189622 RepID=A0A2H6K7L8_9APIC|nr:uroporphyrin-III C-methyltransferase, putative [Babesia ovata]GBE58980.1 uroporphyrin-III C-methyltransferase, putative [Babesia ovata]
MILPLAVPFSMDVAMYSISLVFTSFRPKWCLSRTCRALRHAEQPLEVRPAYAKLSARSFKLLEPADATFVAFRCFLAHELLNLGKLVFEGLDERVLVVAVQAKLLADHLHLLREDVLALFARHLLLNLRLHLSLHLGEFEVILRDLKHHGQPLVDVDLRKYGLQLVSFSH